MPVKSQRTAACTEMELSAIGEQVFAVESIVKKRVRKVSVLNAAKMYQSAFVGDTFWDATLYANESLRD